MSGLSFHRCIGAASDVKELEYCVALHQTVPRDNATVSSTDVRCLLASRYGLKLSQTQSAALVRSLGGVATRTTTSSDDADKRSPSQPSTPLTVAAGSESDHGGYDQVNDDHWFETSWDQETGEVTVRGKEHKESLLSQVNRLSDEDVQHKVETNESKNRRRRRRQTPEVQEEYLDLVQLLSILLIPSMARAAQEFYKGPKHPPSLRPQKGNWFTQPFWDLNYRIQCWSANRWYRKYTTCRPQPSGLIVQKLKALFKDRGDLTDGSHLGHSENDADTPDELWTAPILNEKLVEELLLDHGEVERAQDLELIRDMVQAAQTASGRLDHEALVQAVTMDLKEWEVECEDHLSTIFKDVFGSPDPATVPDLEFLDALKAAERERRFDSEVGDNDRKNHHPISVDAYMSGYINSTVVREEPPLGWKNLRVIDEEDRRDVRDEVEKCIGTVGVCFRFFFSIFCCFFLQGKSLGPFDNERFNVDMVTDEHLSLVVVVVIWLFFLFTTVVYAPLLLTYPSLENVCDIEIFWCKCADTIFSWAFIAILLSIFGLFMMLPLSYGNSARHRKPLIQLLVIFLPLGYALLPFIITRAIQDELEEGNEIVQSSTVSDIMLNAQFQFLQLIPVVVGLLLATLFFIELLRTLFRWYLGVSRLWAYILNGLTASSSAWGDMRLKTSATQKLNKLLMNAHRLHQPGELLPVLSPGSGTGIVSNDRTMRNYVLDEERTEPVGGLGWTWWKILDGSLFGTEGIWINTRLVTIQVAQVGLFCIISYMMLTSVEDIANVSEEARADLDESVPDWVRDLVPTRQMVYRAMYPASFTAMAVMIMLFLIYIPSSVSTVLKFRSQILPSLRSPLFRVYTKAVDSAYMNTANAIYGLIGSAGLFYLLVGLVLFLFQWPFSQSFMIRLLAWGVGLGITMGLKMMLTMSCRKVQFRSFYRIRPHSANLSALALECWYMGLGGSVLLGRITQFLFAALFWVGRIDVTFLSSEVVLFGYHFDYVPLNFVKEILVHEAHRHPYIARLTQMYLMKLRHKDFAGSRASVAWRQLCIVAFFPWLAKNRVFNEERVTQAAMALAERRAREEEYGEGDLRASF